MLYYSLTASKMVNQKNIWRRLSFWMNHSWVTGLHSLRLKSTYNYRHWFSQNPTWRILPNGTGSTAHCTLNALFPLKEISIKFIQLLAMNWCCAIKKAFTSATVICPIFQNDDMLFRLIIETGVTKKVVNTTCRFSEHMVGHFMNIRKMTEIGNVFEKIRHFLENNKFHRFPSLVRPSQLTLSVLSQVKVSPLKYWPTGQSAFTHVFVPLFD